MRAPGFGCFEVGAARSAESGKPSHAAGTASMDMSAMGMADMDMSGVGRPSSDKDGKAPAQCNFECCSGGLIAHAVLITPTFHFAGLGPRVAERVTFGQFSEAPRDIRARLRPAIRAPPQDL